MREMIHWETFDLPLSVESMSQTLKSQDRVTEETAKNELCYVSSSWLSETTTDPKENLMKPYNLKKTGNDVGQEMMVRSTVKVISDE